jgi:hypothetical protein
LAGIKISALPVVASALLTDIGPFVQAGITSKVSLSQIITLFNSNIQLASAAQVTGLNATLGTFLPLAGGTMAGTLLLNTNTPTLALEAASKGYVDTVASGFTVVLACLGATTANLNAVYANGAAGVGATLTDNSGTFAAFTVDGLSPALGSRILVKNQTTTFQNGIYSLTTNGDTISIPWVLTRTTDYDQAPSEIHPGTLVAVNTGTVNATTSWLETATVATIGTDPILFSQFTFAPSAFLLAANNLSDVANVATSRTNLGLGTAATKAASDNGESALASVTGLFNIGNIAVFTDVNGTIGDGGPPASASLNGIMNGRLTLTSGLAVTTSDVTAATIIYFTPYKGNQVSLFDGVSLWNLFTFTELSIAVPGTTNTMYDIFIFDNAGTPTLELQTWTNDTTRAVALSLLDGVYVKSTATTRRYLGSFRTTNVNGQTEDSEAKRYNYNYYNRVIRPMKAVEATNSWNYSVNAYRQANGSTANQLDFVVGVQEDPIVASLSTMVLNNTATPRAVGANIGLDSTTVPSATLARNDAATSTDFGQPAAEYDAFVGIGRHTLVWLERGTGINVQTWYGDVDANSFPMQSGITGTIMG